MLDCAIPQTVPGGFGVALSDENIEAHLAEERAKLDSYRLSNMNMVRRILDRIEKSRRVSSAF